MLRLSKIALLLGLFATAAAVAVAALPGKTEKSTEPHPKAMPTPRELGELDCHASCIECQKPCDNYGCKQKCTDAAASCCATHGKKPPMPTSCFCN